MQQPSVTQELKLSELMSSLSYALDMTEGQPPGHCMRCCWIGMHIADQMQLSDGEKWDLYYTLLLKDLGCSSNAARICQMYMTDDHRFKRNFKWVDGSLSQVVRFVLNNTGMKADLAERFRSLLSVMKHGEELAQELIQTRCERGADIARQLRFSEAVCEGVRGLDEHWDGSGRPYHLQGEAIPLFSRIALMAQVIDVFQLSGGAEVALREIRKRSGSWFDPNLVMLFELAADESGFWQTLNSPSLVEAVLQLEPAHTTVSLDDDYMDEIAAAFGQIVDAKSPYTAGHSERVALYTELITEEMEFESAHRRWLKRGALLHDIGKLGVSNSILDKPDRLNEEEWIEVRKHAGFTEDILSRIRIFSKLAIVAGAHHEKLDGTGYPKRIRGDEIAIETRVITVADIFDAITAERPYRPAIPVDQALKIMSEHLDTAIDRRCFEALKRSLKRLPKGI